MGDFNFPNIDWNNGVGNDILSESFLQTISNCFLIQHVQSPTRHRDGQTSNTLDLILTSEINMVDSLKHAPPIGKSDHDLLLFDLNINLDEVPKKEYVKYFKGNYKEMRNDLKSVNWDTSNDYNVEDSWKFLKNNILATVEKHIPKSSKSSNASPIWITSTVKTALKNKARAYKSYNKTKSNYHKSKFKKLRNIATTVVKKAKRNFEKNLSMECKTNPKAFWKYIKTKTVAKDSIGTLIHEDRVASTDIDKANLLNTYFAQVFTKEDLTSFPVFNKLPHISLICEIMITPDAVANKLSGLNTNKSMGPDGLHPRVLKELSPIIATPICAIINKCFQEGKLPNDWKQANVCCIFKKGDKADPGNYRPISLTNIICKITESFVKDAIYKHLESNQLLNNCQHGFRCNMSCITQLLEVTELLTSKIENRECTDVIYLDFQKAFDKVPHKRLLLKLHTYGIRGSLYTFVSEFLSNREQRMIINSAYSGWEDVLSGIPQGSILGPLLFTIFINDLPTQLANICKMFADDTKIIGTPGLSLQNDINAAAAWSETWQMKFNANKCKTLHFGIKNTKHKYYLDNVLIDNPPFEKDLGIVFNNDLHFDTHITMIVKKANMLVGLIKRNFNYMSMEMFTNLYCTLVRPILEYGEVIWSPRFRKHINLIEAVQRRATKIIPRFNTLTYCERLTKLNLFSLAYRRRRGDLIQVYRILNSIDNINANDFFIPMGITRNRGHDQKLTKLLCTNSIRHHFFSQRVVNDWNDLPATVVHSKNINYFKIGVDCFHKDHIYIYEA